MKNNKYKYLLYILPLFFTMTMSCVSSEKDNDTVEKSIVSSIQLSKSPFYSGFSVYAFIQDSSLISKVTSSILKDSDIDITLLNNLIRKIYVNKIDDDFLLFIEARFDSLVNKKNILKVSNMKAMENDDRLWSLIDKKHGTLYFDMRYKNVVVVTNIGPDLYLNLLFDWKLEDTIQDIVEPNSGFWLYGLDIDFTDKFTFDDKYLPKWGFILSNGYDTEGYLLTTVAIPYSGLRKDLVTMKILLPSILDNFDVRENTSVPFISSIEKIVIIKGIHISPKKVNDYISYITKFSHN